MPRKAREKSESGFYHVIVRGIGRQNIFEDDSDRQKFLETVTRYRDELKFETHAYCLMGNHVHMLIKDKHDQLDLIMKKIAGSYAYYFNWKYERIGHLFQDRYKSEPINDDAYYLAVLRYIHQNPQKAGIAKSKKYKWSSYPEYIVGSKMVNTEFALDMLGGKENFIQFMNQDEKSVCLDILEKVRLTDEKAIEIIKKIAKVKNAQEMQMLDSKSRDEVLNLLKKEGLSTRQIERLTGINRGIVLKA